MAVQGLTGRCHASLEVLKASFQLPLHISAHSILADKPWEHKTIDASSHMKAWLIHPILHRKEEMDGESQQVTKKLKYCLGF